jgi:hypothetical protein
MTAFWRRPQPAGKARVVLISTSAAAVMPIGCKAGLFTGFSQ